MNRNRLSYVICIHLNRREVARPSVGLFKMIPPVTGAELFTFADNSNVAALVVSSIGTNFGRYAIPVFGILSVVALLFLASIVVQVESSARRYLEESDANDAEFVLMRPRHVDLDDKTFDLIQETALQRVLARTGNNGKCSAQQLNRVCSQLKSNPDMENWFLDVGDGWTVSRDRNVKLTINYGSE